MSSKRKVRLLRYNVSKDVFDSIIQKYTKHVELGSIEENQYGYSNKQRIIYNGKNELICRQFLFDVSEVQSIWKQVIVHLEEQYDPNTIVKDINGSTAYNRMTNILKKYYSDEELEEIYANNTHEECKAIHELHIQPFIQGNYIAKIKNCYKYDINSAYASAYINLFPRAKEDILNIYLTRKINPDNKKILNYFNGMLKRRKHKGTYYWVVNRTNEIMNEALNKVGGVKLYINTDGFIVKDPVELIDHSTELGKFKLEYSGNIYTYIDKNYYLIQTGYDKHGKPDFTGSSLTAMRQEMDLSKGIVVHYTRKKEILRAKTEEDEEIAVITATNISKEVLEIHE